MNVIEVEISKIEIPDDFPDNTPPNKDRAQSLAASIDDEGLLHPIGVCDHPDDPTRKRLVYGRERIRAFKALKRKTIPAHDHGPLTDDDRIMAGLSENLMRKPGQKARRLQQLRRWYELREKKLGNGPRDRRAISSPANAKARHAKAATEKGHVCAATMGSMIETVAASEPEDAATPNDTAETPSAFTQLVSDTTGQHIRSTQRDLKIVKSFSDEAINAMLNIGVTENAMLLVASKVRDPGKRDWAVKLLIVGMDAEEVVKTVLASDVTVKPDGAKEVNEDDLTDEQWLEHRCGAKRALIANTATFDRDALLYRHDRKARHKYMNSSKKLVRGAKADPGGLGPFGRLLQKLLWIAHPRDWLICATCKGQGKITPEGGDRENCRACYGAGYIIQMEPRP